MGWGLPERRRHGRGRAAAGDELDILGGFSGGDLDVFVDGGAVVGVGHFDGFDGHAEISQCESAGCAFDGAGGGGEGVLVEPEIAACLGEGHDFGAADRLAGAVDDAAFNDAAGRKGDDDRLCSRGVDGIAPGPREAFGGDLHLADASASASIANLPSGSLNSLPVQGRGGVAAGEDLTMRVRALNRSMALARGGIDDEALQVRYGAGLQTFQLNLEILCGARDIGERFAFDVPAGEHEAVRTGF